MTWAACMVQAALWVLAGLVVGQYLDGRGQLDALGRGIQQKSDGA